MDAQQHGNENVAPWLQGLDLDIELDQHFTWQSTTTQSRKESSTAATTTTVTSASASTQRQRQRHALHTLSRNNTAKTTASRSFSAASTTNNSDGGGSVICRGSVQQRAKSASPSKSQQTLEWKKRLLHGQRAYGEQTDLFAASPLENIFAPSPAAVTSKPVVGARASWLITSRPAADAMPSSPPIWPRTCSLNLHHADESELPDGGDTDLNASQHTRGSSHGSDNSESAHALTSPKRLDPTDHDMAGNRTVSGQTECEDFSPVFISKHTTTDGRTDYMPLDSHFIKRFQDMSHPDSNASDEGSSPCPQEEITCDNEPSAFTDGPDSAAAELQRAAPDLSLSENLPTGTPPSVAGLDSNIQLRRGGYSAQGSFKQRPLSPSPSRQESIQDQNSSSFLSPSPSRRPDRSNGYSSSRPCTPDPERASQEPKSRSSGSPLKLFGPHDTFTSNRLLRRMSQLDPEFSGISEESRDLHGKHQSAQRVLSTASFGSGGLSDHQFDAEITITIASDSDQDASDKSPGSEIAPPGSIAPMMFNVNTSPIAGDTFRLKRRRSAVTSAGSTVTAHPHNVDVLQPTADEATDHCKGYDQPCERTGATGKRPPNSPYKAPTSKRRRTLHASELEAAMQSNHSYHESLQDALRPRNPTPSQRRRQEMEAGIREATAQFVVEERGRLEAVMEQIGSSMTSGSPPSMQQQAHAIANEVAKFSLRVQKPSCDLTERKPSVTTQDFFNEAMMVMRLIREKAGRQSGLGSLAESDQEGSSDYDASTNHDQSALRVSRPPSREGLSGWRPRTSGQTDARVISHLRRFEERDDTEFIAQSLESLHIEEEGGIEDAREYEGIEHGFVAIDENSNIRIKGLMPRVGLERDGEDSSRPSSQRSNQTLEQSQGSSTGKTLHTNSTRKSENVGTLAPDAVAHLIGEQVGVMHYDKDKQQWVKAKATEKRQSYGSFLEPPSNITSDDDPFREISDLPVDEHKEEEIRKSSSHSRRLSAVAGASGPETQDFAQHHAENRATSQETVLARPDTRDSHKSRHTYSSSDPTRLTAFGSSQQQTNETRATSWGDDELYRLAAIGKTNHQPLAYAAARATLDQRSQTYGHTRQASVESTQETPDAIDHNATLLTAVSDDEQLGQEILDGVSQESSVLTSAQEEMATGTVDTDVEELSSPKLRQSPTKVQFSSSHHPVGARQMSLRRRTLTSKFAHIEDVEQSELSFVATLPGERLMSVSMSVSRPVNKRQQMAELVPSSPIKYDPSYILSDLPEFTVHEDDGPRPSEKALAYRLAQHAANEVNDRYALSVKDLVRTLTDVQAEEPYWEDIKRLSLRDRGLHSLHGLEDFCGGVQAMDVSSNQLTYLNGTPASVRYLVAQRNMLTSLTHWTHLMNLQYLDVSSNRLDSLKGLECLIHVRELIANDNQITSLDGVTELDGLLKLRLRRNAIGAVDLSSSQMSRLEELDLCSNLVSSFDGLESLSRLSCLKLDENPLKMAPRANQAMNCLKYFSIRGCGLNSLDVTGMETLRTLIVDDNRLETIIGLVDLYSLETLSMREQRLPQGRAVTVLESAINARTIRLSGNHLSSLDLPTSLLSLQHLELASCGLQVLPDDTGLKLPNLVSLNLNFNSVTDIRPLLNVQRLEELLVCRNRLDRLRKSVATLSKIPSLRNLDMRDNPLTHGFYAPLATTSHTSIICRAQATQGEVEDEDVIHEHERAARFTLAQQASVDSDRNHYDKLDETTKLRRRVCHLMLGHSCSSLNRLDGMTFDKKQSMVKDHIWNRLLQLGIMKKSGKPGLKNELDETP